MRALVACGWFGIQAWIGGEALHTFFAVAASRAGRRCSARGFGGHTTTEWLSFLLFWGLNILIIYRGMDLLRKVENWAAPYVLVMTARAAGVGDPGGERPRAAAVAARQVPTAAEFLPVFFPSLTAMIGFWATLSLNMPDFTRFGRSQREQVVGQVVALPTTMFVFAAMGVMITSATRDHLRRGDLGSGRARRQVRQPARRRHRDVLGRGRDARGQHRRQRRVARERLRERVAALHQLQDRRADHRAARHRDAAVAAAGRPERLHLRLARRATRAGSARSPAC